MIDIEKLKIENLNVLTASEIRFWIGLECGVHVEDKDTIFSNDRYATLNSLAYFFDKLPDDETVSEEIQMRVRAAIGDNSGGIEFFDDEGYYE